MPEAKMNPTCSMRNFAVALLLAVAGIANAQAPAQTANAGIDEGLLFLRANQPQKALDAFQRVLQSEPDNASANLLAASAALNLYKGDLAVSYAEKARKLVPGDWRVDTTLVTAYAVAGKSQERDAERAALRQLHDDPNANDATKANGFLLDLFPVKSYRVEVVEYFKPVGKFHTYYRFLVRNQAEKRVWEFDVQSDDFAQKSWAAAHPDEAAAGKRQFSLESDTGDTHMEYRLFSGEPGYDEVRAIVKEIIENRTTPFPAEAAATQPAVQ